MKIKLLLLISFSGSIHAAGRAEMPVPLVRQRRIDGSLIAAGLVVSGVRAENKSSGPARPVTPITRELNYKLLRSRLKQLAADQATVPSSRSPFKV